MPRPKLTEFMDRAGYMVFPQDLTLKQALGKWEKLAKPAKISHIMFVVDDEKKLVGTIDLRELLLEDKRSRLSKVMTCGLTALHEKDTIQHAVGIAIENEASRLPVLDTDGRLVGVISTDRLLDALNWLNTRNVYNLVGILRHSEEVEITPSTIIKMVGNRIVWLLFAVLAAVFVAGGIIKSYEAAIVSLPAVTFFIPVLMGFGGNIGTQTSTIFVRFLAKKDPVIRRKLADLFIADLATGTLLGITLGAVTAASAMVLFADPRLAAVLYLSMFAISIFAIFVGFLIPYASDRLNLDPAVVSAPVVTAIKDIVALVVYFALIGLLL